MQKVFTFNFFVLVFFLAFISLLSSCENPLFVEATKLYEVSFETNGGTKIDSYHTDRIEKSPETSKAGFTFAGWYKNSSLTAKIESFPLKIESTTTLYAKWNQNYRVDFVTNGGAAVNETNSIETCLLENAPVTNKDGFEVVGWYLNAGFGGVPVSFPYQVNSPVTLYAKWVPVFKVTFVTNGGTAIAPKKTTALKVFPTSERSGYTLVAWYFDEELTENVSFPLELTQSMTLYARWEKNYTIAFESNGGTNLETVNTWCIEQRPEPIKTGLSFGGWYTSSDFAPSTKVTFPFYPNKDTTLYARWNHYDYIVTYELNGGYNHSENPDGFDKGNDAIQLHEPSKIGCEFLGWYDNTNFSGSAVTEIPANTNEDKSFYAKWKPIVYLIEYVLNGGTNDSKNSTSYTVETETFLLNAPSKIGYTFGGWYENAEFSGLARTEIEKGLVGNKKLFAKWTPMEYAISYNLNGGTNNDANPATYTIESETFSFSDASRNGYSFSGWYENADCIGERVTQISKGSYGAKNLYAKWDVITYSIEYVLNGGTFEKVNPSSYTAESETFPLNAPTKTGYNFDGWYESADFNGNSLSQISRGTFGNKVLYAKWTTESYTITYELNGGSLETANPSTYEMATETFILNEPVRIGYNFGGWYETANYTGERVTQIEKGSYGDKKLYAKWNLILYSISYILNGGTSVSENPTAYTVETETFELIPPECAGYTFGGWYSSPDFSGSPISKVEKSSHGNKVLYAKWRSNDSELAYFSLLGNNVKVYDDSVNRNEIDVTVDTHEYYIEYQGSGVENAELTVIANPKYSGTLITLSNNNSNLKITAWDSTLQDITLTVTAEDGGATNTYLLHTVRVFNFADSLLALFYRKQDMLVKIIDKSENIILSGNDNGNMSALKRAINGISSKVAIDLSDTELTTIDANAFNNCIHLNKIILPKTIVSIGIRAFYDVGYWLRLEIVVPLPVTRFEIYSEALYADSQLGTSYSMVFFIFEDNESEWFYSDSQLCENGTKIDSQHGLPSIVTKRNFNWCCYSSKYKGN